MITTTIELACDDCDSPYHWNSRELGDVDSPAQLRRIAKRDGWRRRMRPGADGVPRAVDLCLECVANDRAAKS